MLVFFFVISLHQDLRGLVIVRTATLLLIGTYSPDMYLSVCVEALEKLGRYWCFACQNYGRQRNSDLNPTDIGTSLHLLEITLNLQDGSQDFVVIFFLLFSADYFREKGK